MKNASFHTRICLLLATFAFLALTSPDLEAETYRTHLMRQSDARLEAYASAKDAIESEREICSLGTLSSWDEFIVQVSENGRRNGFLPGDQIVEIDGKKVIDGKTRDIRSEYRLGDALAVIVNRNGQRVELDARCFDGTLRTKASIGMLEAATDGRWKDCMDGADSVDRINGSPIAFTANYREKCSEAIRCGPFRCRAPSEETAKLLYKYRILAMRASKVVGRYDKQRPYVISSIEWLRNNAFYEYADELEAEVASVNAED